MMGKIIVMTIIGLIAFVMASGSKNAVWRLILYAVFALMVVFILTTIFGEFTNFGIPRFG